MKRLALFDFDHSLIKGDSFLEFLLYCQPRWKIYAGMLLFAPLILVQGRSRFKEFIFTVFFQSWENADIEAHAESFALYRIPELEKPEVMAILEVKKANAEVFCVSASFDLWLQAWCRQKGIGLICTEYSLEKRCFKTPNCKGEEKARRIKTRLDLEKYSHIYALGNLPEDQAMFDLAHTYDVIR